MKHGTTNQELVTALFNAIEDDKDVVVYKRRWNTFTGSVLSTLLLRQVFGYARGKNFEPFFKFKEPCEHDWYKEGDSWLEKLGFSRREFETALRTIGTKITKGMSKVDVLKTEYKSEGWEKALVLYWTDSSRITWYQLNENLFGQAIAELYMPNATLLGKAQNVLYLENNETHFTSIQRDVQRDNIYIDKSLRSGTKKEKLISSPQPSAQVQTFSSPGQELVTRPTKTYNNWCDYLTKESDHVVSNYQHELGKGTEGLYPLTQNELINISKRLDVNLKDVCNTHKAVLEHIDEGRYKKPKKTWDILEHYLSNNIARGYIFTGLNEVQELDRNEMTYEKIIARRKLNEYKKRLIEEGVF